jgi:hypothetical protein
VAAVKRRGTLGNWYKNVRNIGYTWFPLQKWRYLMYPRLRQGIETKMAPPVKSRIKMHGTITKMGVRVRQG